MPYVPNSKENDHSIFMQVMQEPYHDYWYHLGKFIHSFSDTESDLLRLLIKLLGIRDSKAGAVFHGIRQETARDHINAILEATKQKRRKEKMSGPFAQIAAIGTLRNNIVHWGVNSDAKGGFTVSNYDRKPLKPKAYQIKIADLKNACADLSRIAVFLKVEIGDFDVSARKMAPYLARPWLYKSPQPFPQPKEPTKDQAKPKRRPRASQA